MVKSGKHLGGNKAFGVYACFLIWHEAINCKGLAGEGRYHNGSRYGASTIGVISGPIYS